MKQSFLKPVFLTVLVLLSGKSMAADFTAVSPSGHTLQYTINTNDPTTVTVGSVMYEDDDAYYGALIIPETVTYNGTTYLVTKIGNVAFKNRSGLTSVSIPNSIFRIQSNAFEGCTGLTTPNTYW